MTPLENRLILHRFLCREFGYDNLAAMLERLRDAPAGLSANGESEFARALYLNTTKANISPGLFADYDAEITAISTRLRMTGEHGRGWKPHQWLALLFTEHYLRRYFKDPEKLRDELNHAKRQYTLTSRMPDYTVKELRTVAVQSATGSGKTLVMHAHILQYRRLAQAAGEPLNNVILVTPNEQMSAQHERDLTLSNLPARLFSSEAGADLDLVSSVEIIDLNKLAERKGVKRVAVSDFGENNLVLVDEGHLGASGKVWRERRTELARGGFTFEYSATFNQIVGTNDDLCNTYGKCLLFDYPYRAFHADGYGKDYAISNLPQGAEDENSDRYLLGCLLSFYWQYRIWREGRAGWAEFNVTRPLWVFLGKTVTGSSQADRQTQSDIVRILDFLGLVLAQGDRVQTMIGSLLDGTSGLTDESGDDYFSGRFDGLASDGHEAIYDDICKTLFHGAGRLHVVYLTAGEGEMHLRTADNAAFGVVNVGDSAALYKMLTENANPDFDVEREAGFTRRLFADVDREDSIVNIVIGARKFIAGWNSWRVSTMGLMHVGVGEGPEIIQMFGRGVRLKGWNMSLKRHRMSGVTAPADGERLAELETLRIFGLRSNYMQTFKGLLAREGMQVEPEGVKLPVTWNFAKRDLKIIRIKENQRYDRSDQRPVLPSPDSPDSPKAKVDMYSRLQAVESDDRATDGETTRIPVKLKPHHIALFNRTRIHDKVLAHKSKHRVGWHNLTIDRAVIDDLLKHKDWYELHIPPERLRPKNHADARKLEDVMVDLIAEYIDQFWRSQRRKWEYRNMEVTRLDKTDPNNIGEYLLSVDATKTQLVGDIHAFKRCLGEGPGYHLKLGAIMTDVHAYKPLLYTTGKSEVKVQPVPLNGDEKRVVEGLVTLAESGHACLHGRELFLIRNLTRGRGVSFFDDFAYYPDFIVWLTEGHSQHIVFLDPKGLSRFGPDARKKVKLHVKIKEIENRVREDEPDLFLHAYVLSVTPPDQIGDKLRTPEEWRKRGVYFLNEPDWPQQVIGHALGSVS